MKIPPWIPFRWLPAVIATLLGLAIVLCACGPTPKRDTTPFKTIRIKCEVDGTPSILVIKVQHVFPPYSLETNTNYIIELK